MSVFNFFKLIGFELERFWGQSTVECLFIACKIFAVLVTGSFVLIVYRRLRELFQVDRANYMLAVCGNDALRELSSPGKSGSFFYVSQDDRFMIKTVKKSEVKVSCYSL